METARRLVVWNKVDLAPPDEEFGDLGEIAISAKHGTGIDELQKQLVDILGLSGETAEALLASVRHRQLATGAQQHLAGAGELIAGDNGMELVAIELQEAAGSLGEILGETTVEQVLDAIFARFCVGK